MGESTEGGQQQRSRKVMWTGCSAHLREWQQGADVRPSAGRPPTHAPIHPPIHHLFTTQVPGRRREEAATPALLPAPTQLAHPPTQSTTTHVPGSPLCSNCLPRRCVSCAAHPTSQLHRCVHHNPRALTCQMFRTMGARVVRTLPTDIQTGHAPAAPAPQSGCGPAC